MINIKLPFIPLRIGYYEGVNFIEVTTLPEICYDSERFTFNVDKSKEGYTKVEIVPQVNNSPKGFYMVKLIAEDRKLPEYAFMVEENTLQSLSLLFRFKKANHSFPKCKSICPFKQNRES